MPLRPSSAVLSEILGRSSPVLKQAHGERLGGAPDILQFSTLTVYLQTYLDNECSAAQIHTEDCLAAG